MEKSEHPHVRKVGRYLAYLFLSVSSAVAASAFIRLAGVNNEFSLQLVGPISIAIFLYLRDLEKNAEARGRRQWSEPRHD